MENKLIKVLIGFICFVIGVGMGFVLLFCIVSAHHPVTFQSMLFTPVYHIVSDNFVNDEEVIRIAEFCSVFENETLVDCVLAQVPYNSDNYNSSNKSYYIRTPKESLEGGMVCRDYATTLASIFKRLGWEVEFRFLRTHVSITAHKENPFIYCNINEGISECWQ